MKMNKNVMMDNYVISLFKDENEYQFFIKSIGYAIADNKKFPPKIDGENGKSMVFK